MMKALSPVGIAPLLALLINLAWVSSGAAQACLHYEDYMHHTFHSPVALAEYDKYCRQILYNDGWVFTVVHVDTGDPGQPVADEVITLNVTGNEAPLPITAFASSSMGYYYFGVRDDGAAFTTTFATHPPPDPHYFASYDISDPTNWSSLDFAYQSLFDPFRKFAVGDLGAYVVDNHPRLYIFNAADPANLVQVNYIDLPQPAKKVMLSDNGSLLFVLGDTRLYIYSLASWFTPIQVSSILVSTTTTDMLQTGSALLFAGVDKVHRYDISNAAAPFFNGILYLDDVEDISAIAMVGSRIYAAGPDGPLEIQDIADFSNPQYLGNIPLTSSDMNPPALAAQGTQVYATFGDRGYFGYDVKDFGRAQPAASIELTRNTRVMDQGGADWFVAVGYGRFRVMSVQNALAPLELGITPFNYTLPTDVWASRTLAYVTTLNGEFLVFDVADQMAPELIGSCTAIPGQAVDVGGSYAFVAAGSEGLKVVSVSNPANPTIVATVSAYYEEMTGVAVKSTGTYVAYGVQSNSSVPRHCGLAVIDIASPWSPAVWDVVPVPLSSRATRVDDYVLLHGEGNLTVVDISNGFFPEIESVIGLPGPGENLTYADGHLYIADGDGGMQVVAWSPGDVPRLVGHLPLDAAAMDVTVIDDYVYLVTDPVGVTVAYKACTGSSPVPDPITPVADRLFQNEPNPFNPSTTITYELSAPSPVTLEVFDLAGRRIATLRDDVIETPGRHTVMWPGCDDRGRAVPSGLYCYRLTTDDHHETRKMALIR